MLELGVDYKQMSDLEFKIKSVLFNVLFAILSIIVLAFYTLGTFEKAFLFVLFWGAVSTIIFAWIFSDWYKNIPNEKLLIEPYIASAVISFPSAICTGLIYMSFMALDSNALTLSEVVFAGVLGGLLAATYSLPISLVCGLFLGLYFKGVQKL